MKTYEVNAKGDLSYIMQKIRKIKKSKRESYKGQFLVLIDSYKKTVIHLNKMGSFGKRISPY